MTDTESKVCERFKEIRKDLKMKQGDFAKEITLTQGHVSDIENKRKGVSDRVMEIICLKFGVSKKWFEYGQGEMYSPISQNDRYSHNIAKLSMADDETIIHWVNLIAETNPKVLKEIEDFMKKLLHIEG